MTRTATSGTSHERETIALTSAMPRFTTSTGCPRRVVRSFIGEPTAWNRGFGTDAITRGEIRLRRHTCTKLRINVFDYNDRAKHILESRGFVQEGKLVRDFYREGTYHDLVILSIFRDTVVSEVKA